MYSDFFQVPASQARILCSDYRDIPAGTTYTKIVSLEMAEVCRLRMNCSQVIPDTCPWLLARWYPSLLSILESSLRPSR